MNTKQEADERWTFDLEHEKKHAQWAWDTNQESLAYCLDGFIAEHERLTTENEQLRVAAMKLDGYWVNDTYSPGKRNVSVRESAFAELRDLLGLKQKTYE